MARNVKMITEESMRMLKSEGCANGNSQFEQGHLKKGRYIMASLRNIVREYCDEIADGICWIAVWKEGRSWNIE